METPDFYALMGTVQLQSEACNFTLCEIQSHGVSQGTECGKKSIFNVNYCIFSWWMLT